MKRDGCLQSDAKRGEPCPICNLQVATPLDKVGDPSSSSAAAGCGEPIQGPKFMSLQAPSEASYRRPPLKLDPRPITVAPATRIGRPPGYRVSVVDVSAGWRFESEVREGLLDCIRELRDKLALPIVGAIIIEDGTKLLAVLGDEEHCAICHGLGQLPLFTSVQECSECDGRGTQLVTPADLPEFVHVI
jgi:hypothetical protein